MAGHAASAERSHARLGLGGHLFTHALLEGRFGPLASRQPREGLSRIRHEDGFHSFRLHPRHGCKSLVRPSA